MLVRQTNEHRPPELDPAAAAVIAAEQWGYHWAHVKRVEEEQKAKNAAQKLKDDIKTQPQCWLRNAVTKLDSSSVAILRKEYADMFECEKPRWKDDMDKHIAKARELEQRKDGKDKDDA